MAEKHAAAYHGDENELWRQFIARLDIDAMADEMDGDMNAILTDDVLSALHGLKS